MAMAARTAVAVSPEQCVCAEPVTGSALQTHAENVCQTWVMGAGAVEVSHYDAKESDAVAAAVTRALAEERARWQMAQTTGFELHEVPRPEGLFPAGGSRHEAGLQWPQLSSAVSTELATQSPEAPSARTRSPTPVEENYVI